jgi:hypothetical protein
MRLQITGARPELGRILARHRASGAVHITFLVKLLL